MKKSVAAVFLTMAVALMGACSAALEQGPSENISVKEEALAQLTCDVPARQDCGWPGITDQQCWDRGCCFDASVPDVPWCYLPWSLPDRGSGPGHITLAIPASVPPGSFQGERKEQLVAGPAAPSMRRCGGGIRTWSNTHSSGWCPSA